MSASITPGEMASEIWGACTHPIVRYITAPGSEENNFMHIVKCSASDTVGQVMYITGDKSGEKWRVAAADPTDRSKMPGLGILISKSTSTSGVLQFFGEISLVFTGLTPNAKYFVGSGGNISLTPPDPGYIQGIGLATASNVLFLPGDLSIIRHR